MRATCEGVDGGSFVVDAMKSGCDFISLRTLSYEGFCCHYGFRSHDMSVMFMSVGSFLSLVFADVFRLVQLQGQLDTHFWNFLQRLLFVF